MTSYNNKAQELIWLLESIMNFKKWGFKQSYLSISHGIFPVTVYDSEWCRVRFSFEHSGERFPDPDIRLDTRYGRSHAVDHDFFLTIEGDVYWCWHDVNDALRFLDGMTPQEAAHEWKEYRRQPPYVMNTIQALVDRNIPHPEREIRTQAAVWQHYGHKLFLIYDLRKPKVWEEYLKFMREFHALIGSESHFGMPPLDKIC